MAKDYIGNHVNPRDVLIKNLLKDRPFEWLVCKVHEGVRGPRGFRDACTIFQKSSVIEIE